MTSAVERAERLIANIEKHGPQLVPRSFAKTLRALLTKPSISKEDAELLVELLELGGDYAAEVFNAFRDKTSPCALRTEADIERFNEMQKRIADRLESILIEVDSSASS